MPESPRDLVRSHLPANVLGLMDQIETFAGLQIEIAENPYPPSPNSAPATEVSYDGARILLRQFDPVDIHGVLHELLHIHRYWIERTPQLQPISPNPGNTQRCSNVENQLEHLVIVPREQDYGFSPKRWNEIAAATWGKYPWPDFEQGLRRRNYALLNALGLELVNDSSIVEAARLSLRQEKLDGEADRFLKAMRARAGNKTALVSCALRFLRVNPAVLKLVTTDIRERRYFSSPIPRNL